MFGIVVMLAALWLAMQIYMRGFDALYVSPEPTADEVAGADEAEASDAEPAERPRRQRSARVPITEYVRDRASRDVQRGADRHGRAADRQ